MTICVALAEKSVFRTASPVKARFTVTFEAEAAASAAVTAAVPPFSLNGDPLTLRLTAVRFVKKFVLLDAQLVDVALVA